MLFRSTFAILVACLLFPEAARAQASEPIPQTLAALPPPTMMPSFGASIILGPPLDTPPIRNVSRWYGWQTMIPLALMDTLTLVSWAVESNRVSNLSPVIEPTPYYVDPSGSSAFRFFQIAVIPVHTLAGPIVHWAHGHVREGFISLGLNMSLAYVPLLPLVMIAEVNHARDLFDIVPLFSVLGVLTANAIDIAILSHDKVESPLSATRGARGLLPSSVALVPMLNQGQQGLAVVGRF